MAVKTITIDMEAYELLSRFKRKGQSFSQVIKEHFPSRKTGRDLRDALRRSPLSDETLDAVEEEIRTRKRDKAREIRW